jgi:hypothetical protein
LFAADLAFLQDFYGVINFGNQQEYEALLAAQAAAPPFADGRRPASVAGSGGSGSAAEGGSAVGGDGDSAGGDQGPRAARPRVQEIPRATE